MLIIRRSNCINTASGMATLCKWPPGAPDGHLQRVTIPDAVLIKFDLPMMSTTLLETCRGLYIGEISPTRCNNCVFYSQWLYSTCFG